MKYVGTRITEDEYNELNKKVYEISANENKRMSLSAYIRLIIKENLNGNTPPKQETIPEIKPDVPKPEGPITTSFNDIEI